MSPREPSPFPDTEEVRPSSKQGRVLIVDDDLSICRALHTTLQALAFDAAEAHTGEEALARVRATAYDVVLLDISMPGIDGIEACRDIRRLFPNLAILMLTIHDSEDAKVEALDAGADDYITKPFHIRELTSRIRAAVRRSQTRQHHPYPVIKIGDIELDSARRIVRKANETLHLTPKEFDLLHFLMDHAGLPITHTRLLKAVWGSKYSDQVEYLRTFVRQLRRKIEDNAADPKYLTTDLHVGYRFREATQ